jgi:hypothetical protein
MRRRDGANAARLGRLFTPWFERLVPLTLPYQKIVSYRCRYRRGLWRRGQTRSTANQFGRGAKQSALRQIAVWSANSRSTSLRSTRPGIGAEGRQTENSTRHVLGPLQTNAGNKLATSWCQPLRRAGLRPESILVRLANLATSPIQPQQKLSRQRLNLERYERPPHVEQRLAQLPGPRSRIRCPQPTHPRLGAPSPAAQAMLIAALDLRIRLTACAILDVPSDAR